MSDQPFEPRTESDRLSVPLVRADYFLGIVFTLRVRRSPAKPGRELTVIYDQRLPVIPGFEVQYEYIVRFPSAGNVAGNHYHHCKKEILVPIAGEVTVFLESTSTKHRHPIHLAADSSEVLFIPAGVAHKVVANTDGAAILCLATSPNNEDDEFPYMINDH